MNWPQNPTSAQPRPLPIAATTVQAYRLLGQHWATILRISWLALLALTAALTLELCYFSDADTNEQMQALMNNLPGNVRAALIASYIVGLFSLASFNVAWRRFLILREPPNVFFIKKPLWRYLGLVLSVYFGGIIFMSAAYVFLATLMSHSGLPAQQMKDVITAAVGCALGVVAWAILIHIPLFTAMTVENQAVQWKEAREYMRGNILRFIAVFLMTMLPSFLFSYAVGSAIEWSGLNYRVLPAALGIGIVEACIVVMQMTLLSSVAALSYDFLVLGGGPSQTR